MADQSQFRRELAGLIFASMAGAAVREAITTAIAKGRPPKVSVDQERAASVLKGLPALAVAATDELLTELAKTP
jgi:hypothetical protein